MNSKAMLQGTDYEQAYLLAAYREEIERAIKKVKRTVWDKWWRRQFYRETAGIAKTYSSHRQGLSGARRWPR